MLKHAKWDSAEYLVDEEMIAEYLKLALETGDKEHILDCLSTAMRARIINQLAKDTGIEREKVFKMFSNGAKPTKSTVIKIAKAVIGDPLTQAISQ